MKSGREMGTLKKLGMGLNALFSGGAERRAQEARVRRARQALKPCSRCAKRIKSDANRCPHCGARVGTFANASRPSLAAGKVANGSQGLDVLRREVELRDQAGQLSELQKQILLAAYSGGEDHLVHVMRAEGPRAGEIKAGQERIYGDEAVEAVELMYFRGFFARHGDLAFELTHDGRHLATLARD
jgi:hypothetical protein